MLVFRLGDEWLATPVGLLVIATRPRIPHRAGLLAGMVNSRGELHLCIRLDLLLGVTADSQAGKNNPRLLVIRRETEAWAFAAEEVDQVHRLPGRNVTPVAPTLSRAVGKLTRGVFASGNRSVGLLDDVGLFQAIRERVR